MQCLVYTRADLHGFRVYKYLYKNDRTESSKLLIHFPVLILDMKNTLIYIKNGVLIREDMIHNIMRFQFNIHFKCL